MTRIQAFRVHAFAIALLVIAGTSPAQGSPVRLELAPRAEVAAGETTLASRDVSQWTRMWRMPSATIVPVNVAPSDRAEATRAPAAEDVTAELTLRNLGGHAFTLSYPHRVVGR